MRPTGKRIAMSKWRLFLIAFCAALVAQVLLVGGSFVLSGHLDELSLLIYLPLLRLVDSFFTTGGENPLKAACMVGAAIVLYSVVVGLLAIAFRGQRSKESRMRC